MCKLSHFAGGWWNGRHDNNGRSNKFLGSATHSKSFVSFTLRERYSDDFPTNFALFWWRIRQFAKTNSR